MKTIAVSSKPRFWRSTRSSWPIFPVQISSRLACLDLGIGQRRSWKCGRVRSAIGDDRIRMPQHALRREDDQRLAP